MPIRSRKLRARIFTVGWRSTKVPTGPAKTIISAIATITAAIMISTRFAMPTAVITESSENTASITTICAILAGYALVHVRLPGRAAVILLLTASLFFPTRLISLIAIFEIQRQLNLINTTGGLILPYVTLNLAISVLIMRGIFQQIPAELVEASRIDGCGPWRTLLQVLLPLIVNGVVVVDRRVPFFERAGAGSAQPVADGFSPWELGLEVDVERFRAEVRRLFGG